MGITNKAKKSSLLYNKKKEEIEELALNQPRSGSGLCVLFMGFWFVSDLVLVRVFCPMVARSGRW